MKIFSRAIIKTRSRVLRYAICVAVCLVLALVSSCGIARAETTPGTDGYKAAGDITEISEILGEIVADSNGINNVDDFQSSTWPEEFANRLHKYDLRMTKSREALAAREIYSGSRKQAVGSLLATTQEMHQILQQWSNAAENHDIDQYNNATDRFNSVSVRYDAAIDKYNSSNFAEAYEYLKQPLKNPVVRGICAMIIIIALVGMVAMAKIFSKAGYAGWKAFVPFYNAYVMCKISGLSAWCVALFFIPVANLVVAILFAMKLSQKFGRSRAFGFWMLVVLAPIGHCLLAFDSRAKYNGGKPKEVESRPDRFGIWLRKVFSVPVSFAVIQAMMTLQYFFDNANEVTTGRLLSFLEFAKIHPVIWLVPVLQALSIAIFIKRRRLHDIVVAAYFALGIFMSFAYYNDADTHLNGLQSVIDAVIGICLIYLMFYLLRCLVLLVRRRSKASRKSLKAQN